MGKQMKNDRPTISHHIFIVNSASLRAEMVKNVATRNNDQMVA